MNLPLAMCKKAIKVGGIIGDQVGIKYYDAFKVKNLLLQLEYNQVEPMCIRTVIL